MSSPVYPMTWPALEWDSTPGPKVFKMLRIIGCVEVVNCLEPIGVVKVYYDMGDDRFWAKRYEPC